MADFLLYALLAGLGVAMISGPLGCFVVWRRMSYFGDTLAHSALLGIALGIAFDLNLTLAIILCCLIVAVLLVSLQKVYIISTDTLLGILAHSSLSLGLIAISLLDIRIDLMAYLFGDLLTVNLNEIILIYIGGGVVCTALFIFWRPLLAITIDEDLAQAEGYPVVWLRLLLITLLTLVIAAAMKVVGALLITSLMIIPAATARRLANSPESMAFIASISGCVGVVAGIYASYLWDTPTGPSIVLATASLFAVMHILPIPQKI